MTNLNVSEICTVPRGMVQTKIRHTITKGPGTNWNLLPNARMNPHFSPMDLEISLDNLFWRSEPGRSRFCRGFRTWWVWDLHHRWQYHSRPVAPAFIVDFALALVKTLNTYAKCLGCLLGFFWRPSPPRKPLYLVLHTISPMAQGHLHFGWISFEITSLGGHAHVKHTTQTGGSRGTKQTGGPSIEFVPVYACIWKDALTACLYRQRIAALSLAPIPYVYVSVRVCACVCVCMWV